MQIRLPPDGIFHHEDLQPGSSMLSDTRPVTREEIIAFASRFDPQPMHLDEEAARKSIVGGLCASGFHSCAIMMRLLCDNFLLRSTSLGSPGLDEVKWLRPVRPGDALAIRIVVLEQRNLQSRPDVGISKMQFDLVDQHGNTVLETLSNQMMRRRHPGTAVSAGELKPKARAAPAPTLWDEPAAPVISGRGNYFEDIPLGENHALGGHTFAADEIIDFARQYDPQPFHLSEEGGSRSLFGGLAASGWHTAAIFIRQNVLARQQHEARLRATGQRLAQWGPSPGFRDLQWPKPVMAGDTIEFRNKVIEKRELKSRPDRGLVVSRAEGRNQQGDVVYRFTGQIIVERRAAG